MRILRPSNSGSWTKSIAQTWLAAVAGARSSRSCAFDPPFGDLLRNCRPISQYSRQTRLVFTSQPSRHSTT
jgi:hypothetical protein